MVVHAMLYAVHTVWKHPQVPHFCDFFLAIAGYFVADCADVVASGTDSVTCGGRPKTAEE